MLAINHYIQYMPVLVKPDRTYNSTLHKGKTMMECEQEDMTPVAHVEEELWGYFCGWNTHNLKN